MKKTTPGRRDRFVAKLEEAINEAEMTQSELARRLGYDNANIITLFKKGNTRVPLDKVVRIANILSLDPAELLREWFMAYDPEAFDSIESVMGGPFLTHAERSWVRGLRRFLETPPIFDHRWGDALAKLVKQPET